MISYPRYVYGDYEKPDTLFNMDEQRYVCPLCNRCFIHREKLMKHINATNEKQLYNVPLHGHNNNNIDDTYFSEWINQ